MSQIFIVLHHKVEHPIAYVLVLIGECMTQVVLHPLLIWLRHLTRDSSCHAFDLVLIRFQFPYLRQSTLQDVEMT